MEDSKAKDYDEDYSKVKKYKKEEYEEEVTLGAEKYEEEKSDYKE